jgi:hypothetical protein
MFETVAQSLDDFFWRLLLWLIQQHPDAFAQKAFHLSWS